MKKEYMRPELTVLSLVVEDNTNADIPKVGGTTWTATLDDNALSVVTDGTGWSLESIFG